MAIQMLLFLLVFFLILGLVRLWHLYWPHLQPSHSNVGAMRTTVQRLLKPRTPRDCPACRLSCTPSSSVRSAPAPVRPWREVKSRRGARHPGEHRGLRLSMPAVPILRDHRCSYPRTGRGWHAWPCRAHPDISRPCLPHDFHCPAPHPLVSSDPPSHHIAMVLSARACGLDASAAERVFGYRQATITLWLSRAGEHAQSLHERSFRNLQIPHLQLDELRTRLRSATQLLWLWLAIDPLTKILPVLQLGPRTQNVAHLLIHSLRRILAAFLPPTLHE